MGDDHNDSFTCLIKAIVNQVKLAAPDPAKKLRPFTEASDNHQAGMLTQVSSA